MISKYNGFRLIRYLGKAGQVASLLLLCTAVLLFLGTAGIFFGEKKILQTKAMIAADAGAMYLDSLIGSYAHYLACKYIDCKCRKTKTNWGMIAAVTLAVVATALGGWAYFGSLAAKWPITVAIASVSTGINNEIQLRMAINRLNKTFKSLSSRSVKEGFKWEVIRYIAMILADDNLSGVMEDLTQKMAQNIPPKRSLNEYRSLSNKIKYRLLSIYDDRFGDDDTDELINDTMGALNIWNSLVGNQLVPSINVGNQSVLATHYLRGVIWKRYKYNLNPSHETLTLERLMDSLSNGEMGEMDGITALRLIKDPEYWNGKVEDKDVDFFYELLKAKSALEQVKQNLTVYDLTTFGPLKTCPGCDDIEYEDGPLETLKEIREVYNEGDTPRMTPGDYYALKEGLNRWIDRTIGVINSFLEEVNKLIADYKKDLELFGGQEILYDYHYSWQDRLGRRHSIGVEVHFKMPRIKVKKSLFKVKIRLRHCQQTVDVTACRNGFCYKSSAHYYAKKGCGPTTQHWWVKGE